MSGGSLSARAGTPTTCSAGAVARPGTTRLTALIRSIVRAVAWSLIATGFGIVVVMAVYALYLLITGQTMANLG